MASMENRSLGRGRVSVPVVGLGTWQRLEAAAASGRHRELIDTAIAAGIRLIDTSPMYGDAERLLADGLGAKRDQVVIADKIWTPSPEQGAAQLARAVDWYAGRIDTIQVPYNPVQREVERTILPLADELGLGVLLMRPLGEGQLVRRQPSPDQLAPLHPFGITTWGQALIKWGLSDPRVHVSLAATARPGRLAENASAGSPPWFGTEERAYVLHLATTH
jgi:aryl-alcohol dehydrogenase-like predicted oxidoreductase